MIAGYHGQDELDRARTRPERELSARSANRAFPPSRSAGRKEDRQDVLLLPEVGPQRVLVPG